LIADTRIPEHRANAQLSQRRLGTGTNEHKAASAGDIKGIMKKKTILIVDDELSIMVPLKFLLEKNNYCITMAQSGADALDSIKLEKPDLILLDIMLPDLDGYEIFQIIRKNREWDDIKVIYLTAKNRDMDIAKGLNLGVDAYVTKPFSNAELLDKIKVLLQV
jgi:DNA-binding response OmpR family regulator